MMLAEEIRMGVYVCWVSSLTHATGASQLYFLWREPHTSVCTGRAAAYNGCSGRPGMSQQRWHSKQQGLVSEGEKQQHLKVIITDESTGRNGKKNNYLF